MTLSWCVFFSFIAYFFHSKSNFVNMIDLDAHLTWAQTKRFWKQTSSFIGRQSQEISLEFEINLVKIHHIKKINQRKMRTNQKSTGNGIHSIFGWSNTENWISWWSKAINVLRSIINLIFEFTFVSVCFLSRQSTKLHGARPKNDQSIICLYLLFGWRY